MLKVQFMGAAKTVTGSCYLVTYNDTKFIIDCGMFQGPEIEHRNAEKWPFNPAEIDFMLLTHAHIDHSGLIPKLTKYGFNGEIYATQHTVALATLLLLDSAKIQELNAVEGRFHDVNAASKSYYNTKDAEKAISLFKSVKFHEDLNPRPGIKLEYIPAGHILGAASIIVEVDGKRIVFSGDIGREEHPLIYSFDPEDKREVDYVIMESLYGGERHPSRESSVYELVSIVKETTDEQGNVLIPAFAVERTQELLIEMKRAKLSGALDSDLEIFLDSPLAIRVLNIYRGAVRSMKMPVPENTNASEYDPFSFPGLHIVNNSKQSKRLKSRHGVAFIAGSGMVNGGRILSHVINNMPDPKSHMVVVGFQAADTYGRQIVEGAKEVVIDDIPVAIKGKVTQLGGFSGHGDEEDLVRWLRRYNSPRLKKVILVHAEPDRSAAFAKRVESEKIKGETLIPDWKEEIILVKD